MFKYKLFINSIIYIAKGYGDFDCEVSEKKGN